MPSMSCDISQVLAWADDLVKNQLPFAVARALTLTAKDAQSAIQAQMPGRFTIRNTWSQRGIVVQPASKTSFPLMSAVFVGDIWNYLFLQESGGVKTGRSGSVAVPEDIRTSPTQILRDSLRPKALMQRKDVFIKDLGGGNRAIYQRLPGHALKLLYVLIPDASIKPRLGLVETAQQIGQQRWAINFQASLVVALATATH
jgi:hypothetical protein